MVSSHDRETLRRLAAEVAELAQLPEQQEKIHGWKRVNSLQEHRPMLWLTEIPWGEFEDKVDELKTVCEDIECHRIEREFRQKIFTAKHLPSDEVVDDVYWIEKKIDGAFRDGRADFGVDIQEHLIPQGDSYVQSHAFEAVIKDVDDLSKIRIPSIRYDEQTTSEMVRFADDIFGDILPVKTHGLRSHWFNPWDSLVRWTSVTQALMDLAVRPDFIHGIMRRMTDSFLSRMTQLEEQNLLDHPYPLDRVGSGGAGYTDELPRVDASPDHLQTLDQWGGAAPQIFGEVSPEMHEEFALNYEIEAMDRCGLNYYGCCEPLHNKMHILSRIPRLRKISISPWCDTTTAVDNAAKTYVFSHKPSPAVFAPDAFDVEQAEKDLRDRLDRSKGMPCEVIMKDISTVRGNVGRLISWSEMTYRLVQEYE